MISFNLKDDEVMNKLMACKLMIKEWEIQPKDVVEESFAFLTVRDRRICGRRHDVSIMHSIRYNTASSSNKKIIICI